VDAIFEPTPNLLDHLLSSHLGHVLDGHEG
jgi:hypothetical protein